LFSETIFIGVCKRPTEGGAMGGGRRSASRYHQSPPQHDDADVSALCTAKLSSFVIFILLGARVFSLTFYGVNGHIWVEHLMTSIPGGEVGFLIVANLLVFFLAFFLDYFELAFIIIPLLAPVADSLGIDLVWFGVMLAVNMQTSFMHPPFGFSLFYLRSVAPSRPYKDKVTGATIQPVTSGQIYMGSIPFLLIQLVMVGIIISFPGIVTHYKSGIRRPIRHRSRSMCQCQMLAAAIRSAQHPHLSERLRRQLSLCPRRLSVLRSRASDRTKTNSKNLRNEGKTSIA
jgi:TRAP-type mannitol/chloroaromatic compound transport system permease large subunit